MAIGKFHLLTFLIRSYESILWNIVKVDGELMDKVTKDTYRVAVNKANELSEHQYHYGSSRSATVYRTRRDVPRLEVDSGTREQPVTSTLELGKQMFASCFYANAITFFADLTVQQCILFYGYYKFFVSKERERKLLRLRKKYEQELKLNQGGGQDEEENLLNETKEAENGMDANDDRNRDNQADDDKSEKTLERNINEDANIAPWMEDEKAIIMLSFLRRSAQNSVMKAIGLVFASLGGAFGSMIYPGWGTLFGTQMGDAAIGALLDE